MIYKDNLGNHYKLAKGCRIEFDGDGYCGLRTPFAFIMFGDKETLDFYIQVGRLSDYMELL